MEQEGGLPGCVFAEISHAPTFQAAAGAAHDNDAIKATANRNDLDMRAPTH
jgi:hypothetical protein